MRYMGLDLNLLVVFQAILEQQSVSGAAAKLAVTQPAASNALQRLRRYFDDDLFMPAGARMIPTKLAIELAGPVQTLLADANTLITTSKPFDPMTADRTFVLSASDHVTDTLIGPALNRIFEQAPNIRIELAPLSEDQWAALAGGIVDLHILPREFSAPDQITVPLFRDRYAVLCDPSNTAVRDGMSQDELRTFRIVAALMTTVRRMRGGFAPQVSARLMDRASVITKHFAQIPSLIVGSDRIAVMPYQQVRLICESYPLVYREMAEGAPDLDMVLQIDKSREKDAGLRWLIGILTEQVEASVRD